MLHRHLFSAVLASMFLAASPAAAQAAGSSLASSAAPVSALTSALTSALMPALMADPAATPAPASHAVPQDEARIQEISKIISQRKDRTPRKLFGELGRMGNFQAFKALERALGQVRNSFAKEDIYSAMGLMQKDADLASKVMERVKKDALSKQPTQSRPAAAALAGFAGDHRELLMEVGKKSDDRETRGFALRGLLGEVSKDPSDDNLDLVMDSLTVPETTTRQGALNLLRRFRTEDAFKRMTKFVGNKKESTAFKKLIVAAIGGFKVGESDVIDMGADMVLSKAAGQKDPILQYYALTSMARRGGTANVKIVEKLAKAKDPTVRRAALLVGARSGARNTDPLKLARAKDSIARQAAAITLGESDSDDTLDALHGLVTDEDHIVRAEAIRQLAERRDLRSVAILIARLGEERGRLRADIGDALAALTGRDYGMNAATWSKFWTAEKDSFEVPTAEAIKKADVARAEKKKKEGGGGSSAAFYGIDIVSDHFALILDTSGSMAAKAYTGPTRIAVAKKQLARTIDGLRDGVFFNVITFDNAARPMEEQLIEVAAASRKDSKAFAAGLQPSGGTNIHDALDLAFEDDSVDTIYLMSDGAPSAGPIVDPRELREEVARWNSVRGITIHCIAVGQDHPLLKGLAQDSSGKYVRVD